MRGLLRVCPTAYQRTEKEREMSRSLFTLSIMVAAVLMLSASAMGQEDPPILELSPYPSPYGGEVIEVESPDVEMLYFHIVDSGLWHVAGTSFHWEVTQGDPADALVELIQEEVEISTEYQGCVWYPFGTIQLTGKYCTYVTIQIDLTTQGGTSWSNTITKHIIPEPSIMLMLGISSGGLLLRKRRR